MAYDDNKNAPQDGIKRTLRKPLSSLGLSEIRALLDHFDTNLTFKSAGSPRMQKNCGHILDWLRLPIDDFSKAARRHGDRFFVSTDAIRKKGSSESVVIPVDDNGEALWPTLYEVLQIRMREMELVNFAKDKDLASLEALAA